jgi:hypothetical protein
MSLARKMFIPHVGHSSFQTLFNVLWIFSLIGKSTLQSFGLRNKGPDLAQLSRTTNLLASLLLPSLLFLASFTPHDKLFTLFMCYDFWLQCYHLIQPFQERFELRRYDPYGLPGGHQVATLLHMKISQTTFEELTYLTCFASKTDH